MLRSVVRFEPLGDEPVKRMQLLAHYCAAGNQPRRKAQKKHNKDSETER